MIYPVRTVSASKEKGDQQRERKIKDIDVGVVGFQGCSIFEPSIVYCSEHLGDSTIRKTYAPEEDDCNGCKCNKMVLTCRHGHECVEA